jgi:hypothetical protein
MTDIDRATALALIAGRLSDYPVIRRLPDDLKAELEPLERGKRYGGIVDDLITRVEMFVATTPDTAEQIASIRLMIYSIRSAAKAQESRLAACGREIERVHQHNMDLRSALEKSAFDAEVAAALRRDFPDLARSIEAPIRKAREES